MRFGERLRALREERGVSLAELARATSYSKSYLSRVETGRRPGNGLLAAACARALGVDPERLGAPDAAPGPAAPVAPAALVAPLAPVAVPVQLPPAPGVFAGREAALAELDGALAAARPRWGEGGPRVWVVDGMGGRVTTSGMMAPTPV